MTAQMTSQEFNRVRANFMRRVKNPSIPTIAFKLAWLIAYEYMNSKTQVAYPAQTTLAADLGVSVRTVQRLLDILERHGLRVVPGDGRTRSSRYWINPERGSSVTPFPPRKGDTALSPFPAPKGRHPVQEKGDIALSPEPIRKNQVKKERASRAPKKARARPAHSLFPEGWQPADLPPDQQADFDHFADHARTCARTCANWEAAWRNWHRKSARMQQQERPNGRSLLATLDSAIDRDAAARYVPGSEGPRPITLDSIPRAAGIRSLPKG